jgi:hypothetical protein
MEEVQDKYTELHRVSGGTGLKPMRINLSEARNAATSSQKTQEKTKSLAFLKTLQGTTGNASEDMVKEFVHKRRHHKRHIVEEDEDMDPTEKTLDELTETEPEPEAEANKSKKKRKIDNELRERFDEIMTDFESLHEQMKSMQKRMMG